MILYQLQHLVGTGGLFKAFRIKPESGIHSTPYVITWVINIFLHNITFVPNNQVFKKSYKGALWLQCEKVTSVLFVIKGLDMNLSLSWKELCFITAHTTHKCWHQHVNGLLFPMVFIFNILFQNVFSWMDLGFCSHNCFDQLLMKTNSVDAV